MAIKERAISDEQKQQRYQDIINTAKELFTYREYKEITMAKIAAEAGLAKGTLFFYFKTKEDLFLSLAEQEIRGWGMKLGNRFNEIIKNKNTMTREELIDILMNSIDNEILVKLFAIVDDTLEQNIDFDRSLKFKIFLKNMLVPLGDHLDLLLPGLKKGDGLNMLSQLFILLIGAYKVCNPSETVAKVVAKPGLELFNRDFTETFRGMVTCYIAGYLLINKE